MLGRHQGFIKYLKKAVPGVLTVHCVIHRQNLVAKNTSDRFHHSLSTVLKQSIQLKLVLSILGYSDNYVLRMMRNLSNYYCTQKLNGCPRETA